MADILIRDVPDEVVAALDANARREGLSRAEYLRRCLVREGAQVHRKLSVDDVRRSTEVFKDALDPDVIRSAWS